MRARVSKLTNAVGRKPERSKRKIHLCLKSTKIKEDEKETGNLGGILTRQDKRTPAFKGGEEVLRVPRLYVLSKKGCALGTSKKHAADYPEEKGRLVELAPTVDRDPVACPL